MERHNDYIPNPRTTKSQDIDHRTIKVPTIDMTCNNTRKSIQINKLSIT